MPRVRLQFLLQYGGLFWLWLLAGYFVANVAVGSAQWVLGYTTRHWAVVCGVALGVPLALGVVFGYRLCSRQKVPPDAAGVTGLMGMLIDIAVSELVGLAYYGPRSAGLGADHWLASWAAWSAAKLGVASLATASGAWLAMRMRRRV